MLISRFKIEFLNKLCKYRTTSQRKNESLRMKSHNEHYPKKSIINHRTAQEQDNALLIFLTANVKMIGKRIVGNKKMIHFVNTSTSDT